MLLAPVGVLIVALLGSVAIDSAAAFLAVREAESAAASLANDIATLALDETVLRRTGRYRIDPGRVGQLQRWGQRIAEERLSAVFDAGSVTVTARRSAPAAVHVTVSGSARRVIGLLGNVDGSPLRRVLAEATARVHVSGVG